MLAVDLVPKEIAEYQKRENWKPRGNLELISEILLRSLAVILGVFGFGRESPRGFITTPYINSSQKDGNEPTWLEIPC